jgi:hypothetical protein
MLGGGGVVKQSDSFGTVPAIAVPVHDKDAFECPEEHVFTIEAAVRSATKVLCVGWRGLEAEFLSKWSKRNAEMDLLIASGNSEFGAETWRNMTAGGFESRQPAIHDGGFGSLLGSSELATFLDRES